MKSILIIISILSFSFFSEARLQTEDDVFNSGTGSESASVPVQCRHIGDQMDALRGCIELYAKVPAGCRHLGGQMDALRVCMENIQALSYDVQDGEEEYYDSVDM